MGSNPSTPPGQGPIPEILPPGQGANGYPVPGYSGGGYTVVPPPPRARPRRRWATAPATWTLLGINCAVYVLMVFTGTSPIKPSSESLLVWGADNAGAVLYYGQWWRIVAAMFIHGGFLHLALNMWCLWNLGMLAEPLMGTFGVAAVYLLTGAAGNLLSTLVNWIKYHNLDGGAVGLVGPVGVGASGAIFGIAGALIILLKSNRLPVPPEELKKLRRSVIYFAAINLVIGFSIQAGTSALGAGVGVDNMAHVGGFACGLLFAAPMIPRIGSPRTTFNFRLRTAVGLVVGVLVLFGFYLAQLPR
jgi:rhomboid protease GluP